MNNVLVIVSVILIKSASTEPSCSKYHYEEKLLEKMIRFEYEMRDLKKEIRNMMAQTSLDIDNFKQDIATLQADVLRMFEDTGRNFTQDITALKDTVNVKTPSVSFRARAPRDKTPSSGKTVIYETIEENLGGGYDGSTGIFVAPVAGLYLFSVNLCSNAHDDISVQLVTESTTLLATFVYERRSLACSTLISQAMLEEENKVWVKCHDSGTLIDNYPNNAWNTFSGFLIHT